MTTPTAHELVQRGVAAGVLPADAEAPALETRPWPVLLLTALGAWLAALPLLGVVGLLLGDFITRGAGPYLIGLLVLAGAVVVLRARAVPLFVEQLAVPAVLVGGGSLAFGVFRDLPDRAGALLLAGVALGLVLAVPRAWLRNLLGAVMAVLVGMALLPPDAWFSGLEVPDRVWLTLHALLALWALALWFVPPRLHGSAHAPWGAALESAAPGWLLVTLAGLAWFAGMSFLVGGAMGPGLASDLAREASLRRSGSGALLVARHAASAGLALLAALLASRAWPLLRRPALAAVAGVLALLSGLLPTLGGALLALALTATSRRPLQAAACALAAAWVLGSVYYQLEWPLGHKALLLAAGGALLGAVAWWMARGSQGSGAGPVTAGPPSRAAIGVMLGTAAPLLVALVGIWQKEQVIRHGEPVFVALAPVDPRSLMQGDYMRLNFRVPDAWFKLGPPGVLDHRPWVVARRDAQGVATLLRVVSPGAALAEGEIAIELTPKNGDWVLVTDAWYFQEGDAERWTAARYGEFRVASNGRALLVGMADANLKPIQP